MLNPTHPSDSY